MKAGLYLVATPIGNMGDITLRALETLKEVDLIACEDTRNSGMFLSKLQIKKPLYALHDHNEEQKADDIISKIKSGMSIALISDAGCPLISDPGYKLVKKCQEESVYVSSIPGASAVITALQLSGIASNRFSFLGFAPNKQKARLDFYKEATTFNSTLIVYETANRLIASLKDMFEIIGDREVAVTRELTKLYEEAKRNKLSELISFYEENGAPKGEIVLVISPPDQKETSITEEDLQDEIKNLLKSMSVKDVSKSLSEKTGINKNEIYRIALEIKNGN